MPTPSYIYSKSSWILTLMFGMELRIPVLIICSLELRHKLENSWQWYFPITC
ncbi:hypothetical protein LEMLEM_LOCUS23194, partial [Lemmus lemmus]